MKFSKDAKNTKRVLAWGLAFVLMLLGLFEAGAAFCSEIYGEHTWYLQGIKIRLGHWEKPFFIGLGFLFLAVLVRPRSFLPFRFLRRVFSPFPSKSAASAWLGWGIIPGVFVAVALGYLNRYLFPSLAHLIGLALIAAAVSAILHYLFALSLDKMPLLVYRESPEEYRSGLRTGLYPVIIILLVLRPSILEWEVLSFAPLWPAVVGMGAGVLLCALVVVFGKRLLPGKTGRILFGVVALVLVISCTASFAAYYLRVNPSDPPHYRVIFITMDTTRADRLSCYGYERKTTPFIDEIAKQGVLFSSAIAPMGVTDPSHASMFTGTYPRTHGSTSSASPITGNVPSLPELFKARGFHTAAIVSRVLLSPTENLNLGGFDYENYPRKCGNYISAPYVFQRAANWLSFHRDRNVFMWVHFFDPHKSYDYHPDFRPKFTDKDDACDVKHWPAPDVNYSKEEIKQCNDLYDGEIAYMDYWIKKLVTYIEELEPKSKSPPLLVLIADHGEEMGEHLDTPLHYGTGHGGILYNQVIRIPFILYWPGKVPEGKTATGLAETVDLAPTLADYVFGEKFPCQGKSLRPVIENNALTLDDDVVKQKAGSSWLLRSGESSENSGFAEEARLEDIPHHPYLDKPGYAVFKDNYKLILNSQGHKELYNLAIDPHEENNLWETEPARARELTKELEKWKERTPETKPDKPTLSEKEKDGLRALGYIK